jgi:hypothetical protein
MVVTTIGQVAEILAMLILGRVLLRLGWRWTMVIGILGHAARFFVFAFFFATIYIFVDAVFPRDIRTSAQGLFNLLILGLGLAIANFLFIEIKEQYTSTEGVVAWDQIFLYPAALSLGGAVLLALFFRPPTRGPARTDVASL